MGNARTALFNWLFARKQGGEFVLRIEDTDQVRTTKRYEQNLLADLEWLGIDWDEGPGKEGMHGPYHQTERLDIYRNYLEGLLAAGRAYPCYCSEEELEAERAALVAKKMMPRYMGKCCKLSREERQQREDEGRKPSCRFRVEEDSIEFDDMIRGVMKFVARSIGDFIIVRSNGLPAYNFAVVIDDHLMNITHVIRGEDHLSNTASQILLYQALGFPLPLFAHHSLILGKDRTKLSKRHGSVSVRQFRERGFLPEALLNYLALMGNCFGAGREVCNIEEIIDTFSLAGTGKSAAVFDEDKLCWLNSVYIKNLPSDRLRSCLLPFIKAEGYEGDSVAGYSLAEIIEVVRENLKTLADIKLYLPLFDEAVLKVSPEAESILGTEEALTVVRIFNECLQDPECPEQDFYEWAINKTKNLAGVKGRQLFMPIRCALTGITQGPELDKLAVILGKPALARRMEKVLQASSSCRIEGRKGKGHGA